MTLKELKTWVNTLSEEELEQDFIYNSDELSVSGVVNKILHAEEDMYIQGDCDPEVLKPASYWINECGYDPENLEEDLVLEIPKGSHYFSL